jgi:hypothetical protein
MRGTVGIIITLLVLLLPPYSLHAQSIRAGGFAGRGISGGMRGARIGKTGSGRHAVVSNSRAGFSPIGPSSSFRGNSVRMGKGMRNSNSLQRGFGRYSSSAGASFGSRSNMTSSTLGKNVSNQQFRLISNSQNNAITPVKSGPIRSGSRFINRARSKTPATGTSFAKTNLNSVSSNNIGNTTRGQNNPLIIDNKVPAISKRLHSKRNGNLRSSLTRKGGIIKPVNENSIPPAPSRDIVRWVDRNNGIRHYTNDINSIPEEATSITLVDGKEASIGSRLSDRSRNVRNSLSRFREASLTGADRTTNLVLEKNVDFPAGRRAFPAEQNHLMRNVRNSNLNDGFHGKKGFDGPDRHHFRHHHFHRSHFFPFNSFFFCNSFFFFRPFFPLSSFFFVNNPFIFQPIFPSPFFGFQPTFVPAAPVAFFPAFPQFAPFTPFINPFFINPFINPFFFRTNFLFNLIAFNNIF